jgi:hypothetical protein
MSGRDNDYIVLIEIECQSVRSHSDIGKSGRRWYDGAVFVRKSLAGKRVFNCKEIKSHTNVQSANGSRNGPVGLNRRLTTCGGDPVNAERVVHKYMTVGINCIF